MLGGWYIWGLIVQQQTCRPSGSRQISLLGYYHRGPCRLSTYVIVHAYIQVYRGSSWSWSYISSIYNYLCHQCTSSMKLWVWIPLRRSVVDTTLCDKICQWLATGRWFSLGTSVSSTNKTDSQDITELLLKVTLSTITLTVPHKFMCMDY
jgi:hypothetical protein